MITRRAVKEKLYYERTGLYEFASDDLCDIWKADAKSFATMLTFVSISTGFIAASLIEIIF